MKRGMWKRSSFKNDGTEEFYWTKFREEFNKNYRPTGVVRELRQARVLDPSFNFAMGLGLDDEDAPES
jgi:hypothetical protein